MLNKDFTEEIYKFHNKLLSRNPFAFAKAADGELAAIKNISLNNGEFSNGAYVPQELRDQLLNSLCYKDENYFLGVICPCCCNRDGRSEDMILLSQQPFSQLTYANLFVNANYEIYKETFLKSYQDWDIHLIAHQSSKIENLPFKVEKFYPIERNAWVNNYSLIRDLQEQNLSNKLFLFCCGPFGNLLTHQLFSVNKNNTYLDIGSTLNPWLQSEGFKRDYYLDGNSKFKNRKCVWL